MAKSALGPLSLSLSCLALSLGSCSFGDRPASPSGEAPLIALPADDLAVAASPADASHSTPIDLPGLFDILTLDTVTYTGAQYWIDSDGIDPDVAGCHFAFHNMVNGICQNESGEVFGEQCNGNVLIETAPQNKDECHIHAGGVGHPFLVDCVAWCNRTGGNAGGTCVVVPNACRGSGGMLADSARCQCNVGGPRKDLGVVVEEPGCCP